MELTGLRQTRGRLQLLNLLMENDQPLSHQELLEKSGLSRVALYRALESLHTVGIVHRVEAGDRTWRYAICGCGHSSHCHPHFTCRICGEVECLSEIALPEISLRNPNVRIEEQELYLRGVCARCGDSARK